MATNRQTKPTKFRFACADKWLVKSPLLVVVIEGNCGYTIYHHMQDGKLSWPMHSSQDTCSQYLRLQ